MQSSSPLLHLPTTPSSSSTNTAQFSSRNYTHTPLKSSPLALPESPKSPVSAAQARRYSQYKSRTPIIPVASSSKTSLRTGRSPNSVTSLGIGALFGGGTTPTASAETPQTSFLRQRFKARCFERAAKARDKAIKGRRYIGSSDGYDEMAMDCENDEEEEEEDDIMQDELFRRIISNANRKTQHSYRLSYAHDVGSSVDPDIEDVGRWEEELREDVPSIPTVAPPATTTTSDFTPADLEDEELEAYAEECARRAALEDFEGLDDADLFEWSDGEDAVSATTVEGNSNMDTDMVH